MTKFNIGDKVRVHDFKETGVVTYIRNNDSEAPKYKVSLGKNDNFPKFWNESSLTRKRKRRK